MINENACFVSSDSKGKMGFLAFTDRGKFAFNRVERYADRNCGEFQGGSTVGRIRMSLILNEWTNRRTAIGEWGGFGWNERFTSECGISRTAGRFGSVGTECGEVCDNLRPVLAQNPHRSQPQVERSSRFVLG